jgi:hypothetical protein
MRFAAILSIGLMSACSPNSPVRESTALPSRRVIAYLANVSATGESCRVPDGCEWRMVDPHSGHDELIMTLAGVPLNVWWDPAFTVVHYRLASKLYRAAWSVGANPEEVITVPAVLARRPDIIVDLWKDATSGKWRIKSLDYEGTGNDERAIASVWEYNAQTDDWVVLDRQPSECGCGDCPCAEIMNHWVRPAPRAALHELLDNMRVASHLEGASAREEWAEGRRAFNSTTFPDTSYQLNLILGDSYHAMAPFVLSRGGGKKPQTIYDKGGACGDQLAFQKEEGFLLLTAEFTGGCARLVNLSSGHAVVNLPATTQSAVWANRPQQ